MGNWDNEIDEVARRMTEGEPGAAFRAQVLARMEKADATGWPRPLSWTWPAVAGIAVLALVIAWPAWKTDWIRLEPDAHNTAINRDRNTAGGSLTDAAARGPKAVVETRQTPPSSATATETSRTGSRDIRRDVAAVSRPGSPALTGSAGAAVEASRADRAGLLAAAAREAIAEPIDAIVRADGLVSLAPPPIDIEPLRAAVLETPATIQVPGMEIAPLGVPRLTIARLEVPAMGDE